LLRKYIKIGGIVLFLTKQHSR